MKINQLLCGLGLTLIFVGCGGGNEKTKAEDKKSDLAGVAISPSVVGPKFQKEVQLPFIADTSLLLHLDTSIALTKEDITVLTSKWFEHDLVSGAPNHIKEFLKIDSLKKAGKYQQYYDSLDLGMTRDARAYAVAMIPIDEETSALVWSMWQGSYEACPYWESTDIYFTLWRKNEPTQTFLLAGYETGADAPVSMERTISGKLNKDATLELTLYEKGEDADEPEMDITREYYKFAIDKGVIKMLEEKKEKPVRVKRPRQP